MPRGNALDVRGPFEVQRLPQQGPPNLVPGGNSCGLAPSLSFRVNCSLAQRHRLCHAHRKKRQQNENRGRR
jgi:hypothetical protein